MMKRKKGQDGSFKGFIEYLEHEEKMRGSLKEAFPCLFRGERERSRVIGRDITDTGVNGSR